MIEDSVPTCNSCHQQFDSFGDLARHIASSKTGHKRGKAWAAKYLMMNSLSMKARHQDYGERQPLTEEQKETKDSCIREISGLVRPVRTVCPKCHEPSIEKLPVEYVNDLDSWKVDGKFIRLCQKCGG